MKLKIPDSRQKGNKQFDFKSTLLFTQVFIQFITVEYPVIIVG